MRRVSRNCPGALELVNIHKNQLSNFKARQGLLKWYFPFIFLFNDNFRNVLVEKNESSQNLQFNKTNDDNDVQIHDLFNIFEDCNCEEVMTNPKIKTSMFPDSNEHTMKNIYQIQNSMRVIPHDQNTCGGFIALFHKNKHISFSEEFSEPNNDMKPHVEIGNNDCNDQQNNITPKNINSKTRLFDQVLQSSSGVTDDTMIRENTPTIVKQDLGNMDNYNKIGSLNDLEILKKPFIGIDPEDWDTIQEYYGLKNFPVEQLVLHKKGEKTINFISQGLAEFLSHDTKYQINRVNIG